MPGAEISYRPRAGGDRAEIAAELAERRALGTWAAPTPPMGPQLDEVELRLAGRALRRFASQGQQRIALLALLFAERAALLESGPAAPLMLLDDVMSELDPEHRRLLVSLLEAGGPGPDHARPRPSMCRPRRRRGSRSSEGSVTAAPKLRAA